VSHLTDSYPGPHWFGPLIIFKVHFNIILFYPHIYLKYSPPSGLSIFFLFWAFLVSPIRATHTFRTNSMKQSPSCEAKGYFTSWEITHIIWYLKIHYRYHKSLLPYPCAERALNLNIQVVWMYCTIHPYEYQSLYVLLTVHHSISASWNQRGARFIQFIEIQGPVHVSNITFSSSGGATQTAFGILRAYSTSIIRTQLPNAVCAVPLEDEQVMLETRRGPWFLINEWKVHHVGFFALISGCVVYVYYCCKAGNNLCGCRMVIASQMLSLAAVDSDISHMLKRKTSLWRP
jgi:hypothetical protein